MKTRVITCSILLLSTVSFAQEGIEEPAPPPIHHAEPVKQIDAYDVVDEPAEFPGGKAALTAFLGKNMRYPATAIEQDLQGKCYLKFMVDKEGSISDIRIQRGVLNCPECDKEALRLISIMPKWKPAKVNAQPVNSYFNLPVQFSLN